MRASVSKVQGITIVSIEGQLNFETILPFRKQCIEKLWGERVIFSFESLSFVGSSGITSFFETIKDFIDNNSHAPKFCCVRPEFQKLFEAWFSNQIEIYDKADLAVNAYNNPEHTSYARKLNSQNLGLPKLDVKEEEMDPVNSDANVDDNIKGQL